MTMKGTTRPLNEAEKRLLCCAISHRKRRLRKALRSTLSWGVIVFGALWGLSVLATVLDKRGLSWYVSGLIWLAIGFPMTLWSYVGVRSDLVKAVRRFESALRENAACIIRIRSEQMVDFEEEEDEGACYAFQLAEGRIFFLSGQEYYSSGRFPNSDFTLVDISSEDGTVIIGHIEKRGRKLMPIRTIPAKKKTALKIPNDLQVINGDLSQIEQLLS